jgi:hypothetical protein
MFMLLALAALALACGGANNSGDDDHADDDAAPADDDAADDDAADDDAVDDDADDDTTACWTDLPVGEKAVLAQGFAGSEGIGFSSTGELYVSAKTGVAHVHPDGSWEMIATLTYPIGIAFGPDDVMNVCDFGASILPGVNDGAMYRVTMDGATTLLAGGIANPNFVTYTPWGTLLVSDAMTQTIYEVTLDGTLTHWIDGVAAPNGMVFSEDRRALYVAGTLVFDSPVYRVDLDESGHAQTFATIAHLDAGALPDGAALDENGLVYLTENGLGKIVRVDPTTGAYEVVASGMKTPASMAFGRGPNFDPCSIYVTETFNALVWRVSLGVHGYPLASE